MMSWQRGFRPISGRWDLIVRKRSRRKTLQSSLLEFASFWQCAPKRTFKLIDAFLQLRQTIQRRRHFQPELIVDGWRPRADCSRLDIPWQAALGGHDCAVANR